jgi:hypothetical protein
VIRHIVMWKFLGQGEGKSRAENLLRAEGLLRDLPARIREIDTFEVRRNIVPGSEAFDLVLNATFQSMEHLHTYQDHEDHQRVVRFLRAVRSARAVADFEY